MIRREKKHVSNRDSKRASPCLTYSYVMCMCIIWATHGCHVDSTWMSYHTDSTWMSYHTHGMVIILTSHGLHMGVIWEGNGCHMNLWVSYGHYMGVTWTYGCHLGSKRVLYGHMGVIWTYKSYIHVGVIIMDLYMGAIWAANGCHLGNT